MQPASRRAFPALLALALAAATPLAAQRVFRISLENPESHVQSRMVRLFAERFEAAAGGTVDVELRTGAALYRDADAVDALFQGKLEMAVPGNWHLDRFVPDYAALLLPSVYGRGAGAMEALADGPFGRRLDAKFEEARRIVVLGRWIELGHIGLFGVRRRLGSIDDLRDLRVRVSGGRANEERIAALGARPVSISVSDLSSYLERGAVGAILTSYETVLSAGLDEKGVTSSYEDREFFAFYLPLVSRTFWDSADEATRRALKESWESIVPEARAAAAQAQEAAKRSLVARGLAVRVPGPEDLEAARRLLFPLEEAMAERLGVSPEALTELRRALSP